MGRGDSSWQDRNHHIGNSRGGKKTSTGKISPVRKIVGDIETTPTVDTSVGTEGYDDTKATTAAGPSSNPQVGESITNSGGTGSSETYDFSKGSKAVSTTTQSTTSKKRKSSLKVNISGAGGTGRNIV
jgi:hypothetical protein